MVYSYTSAFDSYNLVFVNSSDSDSVVLMTLLTTDLLFSQGHDSSYDYYSDYVASENQLLRGVLLCGPTVFTTN